MPGASPATDSDVPPNPWFSWSYVTDHADQLRTALGDHVYLTVVPVTIALLIAFPMALIARRWRRLEGPLLAFAGALYTIPSLALFGALWPTFGLSRKTVVIGLTVYALLILLRNLLVGLDGVPDDVRDAARGMGFRSGRLLWRVELPLALPTIMAGVRIATVSTIGLVTVGSVFGNGGFGQLIIDGFQNNFFHAEIMTGVIACVLLAIVAELLLLGLERLLTPWTRRASRA
jgi:osmoprotectant transport system permease protein